MRARVIYKSYIERAFIRGSSARDIELNSLFGRRRVWRWHTWRVMRQTCPMQCHTQPLERQRKIYIPRYISTAQFSILRLTRSSPTMLMCACTRVRNSGKKRSEISEKGNHSSRFLEQSISISRRIVYFYCLPATFMHVPPYICVSVE